MSPVNSPAQNADSEHSESLKLEMLWRTFIRNLWIVAGITAFVFGGTVFFTLGEKKIYQATAILEIDPSPPSPLGSEVQTVVAMGADSYWANQEYYETQYQLIQSRRVAAAAVATLGLAKDIGFLYNLPKGAKPPPGAVAGGDAVAALLGRLRVDPVKDSRLVNVSFLDANPERAQRVLGAVVTAYLDSNVDHVIASISSASDWLRAQVDKLKTELEGSEMALQDYKKANRILSVSLDQQAGILRDEIELLNRALTEVRIRRENVASRYDELAAINIEDPVNIPATDLLASDVLAGLRHMYLDAKTSASSLIEAGKGANHPEVRAANAKVGETREALVREIENVRGAVKSELTSIDAQSTGLSRLVEAAKQRAFDLGLVEVQYRRLERAKTTTERLYGLVVERSKESDLTGMMRFNNIHVIQEPLADHSPVAPRVPVNLGIGLVLGVGLGLVVAFGREHLDRSLRNSDQVERELALPCLGFLPQMAGEKIVKRRRGAKNAGGSQRTELLVHDQPSGGLAEATRVVRTNLMLMSPDKPFKVLLVTSSQASEGKTTVASAIAIAVAQAGQRVLLVDCDLRRSRLHAVFDVSNDVGATGVTVGASDLNEAVSETVVPNLFVLPSGPRPPNPAEILQSERFKHVLEDLKGRYDRIIIDSPPISVVSDGLILGAQVDATVFVVRAGKTKRDNARKATRSLRDVSAPVAGIVLNGLDLKREEYYGRYHNHYYTYVDPAVSS